MTAFVGLELKLLIALAGVMLTLLTHTFFLARWGGKVTTLLKGHEHRITRLENIQDRRLT